MKLIEKLKNLMKFCITISQRERENSGNRDILPLPKREMNTPHVSKNQKTRAEYSGFLTRRQVESNHIPSSGINWLSDSGQNRPATTSSNLRDEILTNSENKNNRSVSEVAVSGPDFGNIVLSDNHNQYSKSENLVKPSVLSFTCPYCSSKNFVKRGTRQKKSGKTQLYICKDCNRTFTPVWTKNRQHSWSTMLEAISYYNLGFSLAQVSEIFKQKFQIGVQPSTVAAWVEQNKEICSYHRMRNFAVKHFSPYEVIDTCTLAHRQLYRFRYHRAKTKYIMEDDFKHYKFYPLKEFLDNVSAETPHQYFSEGLRASEAPLKFSKTEMIVRSKANYATKLTELVFQGVSENKARHEALQRFLIANDSVTVATEVPVYIKREDLAHMMTQLGFLIYQKAERGLAAEVASALSASPDGTGGATLAGTAAKGKGNLGSGTELRPMSAEELPKLITGHIDFLQIRNGSVHILDYKSNAAKERPIEQLTLYALALSRLTGLRLFYFKCAWFDEKDYFEFFPLHVVYKPGRGRKKIYTKEGVYNINEKMTKMESLRPAVANRKTAIGKPNF